jgi:hypothetical protein
VIAALPIFLPTDSNRRSGDHIQAVSTFYLIGPTLASAPDVQNAVNPVWTVLKIQDRFKRETAKIGTAKTMCPKTNTNTVRYKYQYCLIRR